MKRHLFRGPLGDVDVIVHDWADESLDEDAMDLDEWAFLQGYYEDV